MNDTANTIVQQVERWFQNNCRKLSSQFPILHFHLMDIADKVKGKVVIQADGPLAGASITFWNKGNVEVLALDKRASREYSLDDRKLTASDNVNVLLQSYFDKIRCLGSEE